MSITTMGELVHKPPPSNSTFYNKVIQLVNKHYTHGWQSWVIKDIPYVELFGDSIDPEMEKKIRFALPSLELTRAYNPEATQASERVFKEIRHLLLDWPFGRALLFSPQAVVAKIHDNPTSYNNFMDLVKNIKLSILSNKASLRGDPKESEQDTINSDVPSSSISACSEPKRARKNSYGKFAKNQEQMYNFILEKTKPQNKSMKKLQEELAEVKTAKRSPVSKPKNNLQVLHSVNASFADNTSQEGDKGKEVNVPCVWKPLDAGERTNKEEELRQQIAKAQRQLSELSKTGHSEVDFSPNVRVDAKITQVDPELAAQGSHCQRFGSEAWKNIKYKDVQRNFQATPVFTSLKVNSQLAVATPSCHSVTILEKIDGTLAAIVHGLLQQRKAFQDICQKLPSDVRKKVNQTLLASDAQFRTISDNLLQYTCGKRAEIIQKRREVYRAPNQVINQMLHDIPPSETHLFSEAKLSELVKDQGGPHKMFLTKFKRTAKASFFSTQKREKKNSFKSRDKKHRF